MLRTMQVSPASPPPVARLHLVLVWINDNLEDHEAAAAFHRLAAELAHVGRDIASLKSTKRCVTVLAHGLATDLIAAVQQATPSSTEALVLPVTSGAETIGLSRHLRRFQTIR
jgi:hypothetical protein